MNRDTLYSQGVFDLDAGPVSITLPDTGKRFMSLLVIDEDHYTQPVVYAPGTHTYTRAQVGTRYVMFAVRTLANPTDAADLKAANAAQDLIKVKQAAIGRFEIPNWDSAARDQAPPGHTFSGHEQWHQQGRSVRRALAGRSDRAPAVHGGRLGWQSARRGGV